MSPRTLALCVTMLLPLAGAGCEGSQQEVGSVGPQSPTPVAAGAIRGPFVQAGTVFTVTLDQAIDTYYTAPGARFTATVRDGLLDQGGRAVVLPGAKVAGTLASVGATDIPLIRMQLERIETVAGLVPLHAAVRSAEHFAWAGPPTPDPDSSNLFPRRFTDYGQDVSEPREVPGHTLEGRALMQPRELRVPAGAVIQLVLTEPLVLPGADLAR
jgi:hypothetical protein